MTEKDLDAIFLNTRNRKSDNFIKLNTKLKKMNITSEQIKLLREKTGAGIMNCKNALLESKGHFNDAIKILNKKGIEKAEKLVSRTAAQGIIASYIHTGSKIGVLIEINCETDFVARRQEFQNLAQTLAMQIAATEEIKYISIRDIPNSVWDFEMSKKYSAANINLAPQLKSNDEIETLVTNSLRNSCLLNQMCLRNPDITVEEYIKNHIALLGENIKITKFVKFILGEA